MAIDEFLKLMNQVQGEGEDDDPQPQPLVFRIQAQSDGSVERAVKPATEAWTVGDAKDCFLCEGQRYIPVTERAEVGPVMFPLNTFPGDWAACPECNAGAADPSSAEGQAH